MPPNAAFEDEVTPATATTNMSDVSLETTAPTSVVVTVSTDMTTVKEDEVDPYALVEDFKAVGPPWSELDTFGRVKRVVITFAKLVSLLALLYLFVCSLSFMASGFRLLGGKAAGEAFSSNKILSNPIAGLMIGILVTVLVQSSSTSTSIVVTMVASRILEVRPAIPIIMGANIGTSVTNTLVSLAQASDREQFRRAFAGAVVHDMFNGLCVIILLPLELATGYLYEMTYAMVTAMNLRSDASMKKEFLKKITKPFTNYVIQIDKAIITKIAIGDDSAKSKSLVKYWCDKGTNVVNSTLVTETKNVTDPMTNLTSLVNVTSFKNVTTKVYTTPCSFLFHDTGLSDTIIGVIMLVCSLVLLCCCLVLIVKLLHSMLRGQIATVIRKTLNNDFPKPFGFLTGYFMIIVGAGMTILVQSSSIFTSAMTPLVGLGIVTVERMFPLTLGSNIGTTATGVLAALASSGDSLPYAIQIALCHLFFNISGILIWFPVPAMRRVPISMAKKLGNTTANYRWFAPIYIAVVFFMLPASIFGLSLAGWIVFGVVFGLMMMILIFVVILNVLQSKAKKHLPTKLQTWEFAPLCLHSLEPYDRLFVKLKSVTGNIRRRKSTLATPVTVEMAPVA